MKATPQQTQAIHAVLWKKGLLKHKEELVLDASEGRTRSSRDLTKEEAKQLLTSLNDYTVDKAQDKTPMLKKLFAMCHEMGWITKKMIIGEDGKMKEGKDYARVYSWVEAHGYLKKKLNRYTYNELPKLISVFEEKIYKPYLKNLSA